MKRCVVLMIVLAMTVMLFAGCGRPAADVSEPSQLPEAPPPQEEPIEKMPKAPRALEAVPAEELMSANPVGNAAGFSIWLKDSSGSFLQELPYSGQLQRGQVIAALPGEDGHILGNYETDKDQWGTLSPLGDGLVCFNNYSELAFIDTNNWTDTGFELDFQIPAQPNYRISSLARDPETGEFAVIYQVSGYQRSADGQVRPWMVYDNHPEYGATDAHMEIQQFDSQGDFLQCVVTELEPRVMNDVADCLPNRYSGGKVTFLHYDYAGALITCDLASGAVEEIPCDGAVLTDQAEILYSKEYREEIPGVVFHYTWYEKGEEIASLALKEERDILTMAAEQGEFPLYPAAIDQANKTVRLGYRNMVFHQLDFAAGTAAVEYVYSHEELTDLVMTSPDGRYEIYRLGEFSGGEARFEELVSYDTETGETVRLGMLNNVYGMVITNQNRLTVTYFGSVEDCSLKDGVWRSPLEAYRGMEDMERKPLDLLYDSENGLVLLVTALYFNPFDLDFQPGMVGTMAIEVYQDDWTPVRTVDTGAAPPYELKAYGPYSPGFVIAEPGVLQMLSDGTEWNYLG